MIAGWVALLTIGFKVVLAQRLHQQTVDALVTKAESVAATLQVSADGTVSVAESTSDSVLDSGVWVYQGLRNVERSPGDESVQRTVDLLAHGGARFLDGGHSQRFYASPIARNDRQVAQIVVATSRSATQNAAWTVLWASAVLAVLLLAGAYPVVRVATARALRPVDAMTAQAAEWSAHSVGQRFGRHQRFRELQMPAQHLDAVLDHLSAVVRHERQLSAELSHELRTPLARIVAETDLLLGRPRTVEESHAAYRSVLAAAASMQTILDTLLATARTATTQAPGRCEVRPTLEHLRLLHPGRAATIEIAVTPRELAVGVEAAVLERILSPIVENALRHAERSVAISAADRHGMVAVQVTDDGPGIPAHLVEDIFTPGFRANADDGHPGAGLGLALARRLARVAGGNVTVVPDAGSTTFHVELPAG